jgi:dimethylsulfone monooxygenase
LRRAFFYDLARHLVRGNGGSRHERAGAGATGGPRDRCLYGGVVTCRPTAEDAQDYYRHAVVDNADWPAVDNILAVKNITPQTHSPQEFQRIRDHQANGMGGLPLVGDPDSVARDMARLAQSGLSGIAVSFVNYLDELPYFCAEVLLRLARVGLRDSRTAGRTD